MGIATSSTRTMAMVVLICVSSFGQVTIAAECPAQKVTAATTVRVASPATVALPGAVCGSPSIARSIPTGPRVVETQVDEDVVYSPISNQVESKIPVFPAVVAPIDTLKLQAMNRINSGLVVGRLTNEEATELTAALDQLIVQENQFKLASNGLTASAVANLERKFHMLNLLIDDRLNNTNTADYMPSFENRRAAIQSRITYNEAAGNLTPAEAEQMLAALSVVTDHYAQANATGGTLTADELEQLHRELTAIRLKTDEKANGTIAVVVPDTVNQRARLLQTIRNGVASCLLTPAEANVWMRQYNRISLLEQSIAQDDGVRSPDMAQLAKEIENLDFVLSREIRDRKLAGFATHL